MTTIITGIDRGQKNHPLGGAFILRSFVIEIGVKDVYLWKNTFSSTYSFYSASNRQVYDDSLKQTGKKFWLIYEESQQAEIDSLGLELGNAFSVQDYEITRLKKNFIDPATRNETLDEMVMAEVNNRKN